MLLRESKPSSQLLLAFDKARCKQGYGPSKRSTKHSRRSVLSPECRREVFLSILLLDVTTGTCRRSLLRCEEGARSRLLGPGRAVANVNTEIIVACSSRSSLARPHSFGISTCPWAEAPEVVRAQGLSFMHSQQTALPQRKFRVPV